MTARTATTEPEPAPLYIGGEWCPSSEGKTLDIHDPATGNLVERVSVATTADVARALSPAAESWRPWSRVDAWSRAAILRRIAGLVLERREEIAATMTEEQGKPLAEARAEVGAAAEQFDWYADEARRIYGRVVPSHSAETRIFVTREPVGPVAAFTAWNFPALLPARKLAPALAAGCSIVLKPAEEAPRTALALALACHDAGVPPGVVNVVVGDPSQITTQLLSSDVIRKVTLTGSVPVGQHLLRLAAEGVKSVTMELGGHAPVLVLADADVDRAIETCVAAKFRNCGQVCISPTRAFVSQIVPYVDRRLERDYLYARALLACLPGQAAERLDLGSEVALTHLKIAQTYEGSAALEEGGGEVVAIFSGRGLEHDPESERLSRIVDVMNERFGLELGDADQLLFDQFEETWAADEQLAARARNNDFTNFRLVFDRTFLDTVVQRMDDNEDIFKRILDEPDFQQTILEHYAQRLYGRLRAEQDQLGLSETT